MKPGIADNWPSVKSFSFSEEDVKIFCKASAHRDTLFAIFNKSLFEQSLNGDMQAANLFAAINGLKEDNNKNNDSVEVEEIII